MAPRPAVTSVFRSESGFTLADVAVALAIMLCAAAGVAGLVAVAARATQAARSLTSGTALATQRMEQLRALTWTFAGNEAGASRVTDTVTDLSMEPPTTGGRGLLASPSGALDRNTAGYVDYLDASGRWVGTGTTPPADAVFIRRWSVEPLPADPDDTLMLHVLVTRVVAERGVALAAGARRHALPGDAILATLSTRRAP